MATIYDHVELFRGPINLPPLTLSQKADLGKIIFKEFLRAGYTKKDTIECHSQEPEGFFKVIDYPASFSQKINEIIVDFYQKKGIPPNCPEKEPNLTDKVTEIVTPHKRKRVPFKAKPIKKYSAKPENPTS